MSKIEIGIRLSQLRKYIGISRNSLAKASEIPAITIKSWEAGISEIRESSLKKYLAALAKLGCYATTGWVLNGIGHNQNTQIKYNETLAKDSINVAHIIELLSKTSSLFFYLDIDCNVMHINHSLLFLLDGNYESTANLSLPAPLKDLCNEKIYNISHENFILCKEKAERRFSYIIKNSYNTTSHMVDMLYLPLIKHKSNQVLGVLCFLSNTKTEGTY